MTEKRFRFWKPDVAHPEADGRGARMAGLLADQPTTVDGGLCIDIIPDSDCASPPTGYNGWRTVTDKGQPAGYVQEVQRKMVVLAGWRVELVYLGRVPSEHGHPHDEYNFTMWDEKGNVVYQPLIRNKKLLEWFLAGKINFAEATEGID